MIRSVLRISGFGRLAVRHFKRCLDGQNNVGSNGCWLGFHSSRELKFQTGRSLGVMVLEAEPNDPSEQPTPPSSKLYQLADDIANLTLLEVADLNELLKQKLGMPDIPMAGMMSGGGQAAAAAPVEAEKPAEKTAFDIKLEKYEASAKIKIIKEVRAFTNLGLKEAKELVEKTPAILKKGATKEEATQIIERITAAGGTAVME